MSTEYDTTPVVDAVGQMAFSGNIIHRAWLMRPELRLDNKKLNTVAVMLLADCIYWYRPAKVIDEATHQITRVHKRFKADMWHIDYAAWDEAFGFSERQVRDAASFLVKRGLLRREVRNSAVEMKNGQKSVLPSRVFLEPIPEAIQRLHEPLDREDSRLTLKREGGGSRYNVSDPDVKTGATLTLEREHTRDYGTRDSETKENLPASQSSAAPSAPSAFKLRPKKRALPAALKERVAAPEAPKAEEFVAPWEEEAERLPEKPPAKKKPRKEPKYPAGVMQAMTQAVTEACYPEGGVTSSKGRLIGVKAAELLDAGYQPQDAAEIAAFLRKDAWWRNKVTPGALVSEAPRWKSATAKRRPASTQQSAPPEEITPEMQAELDRLAAHFANDPFGDDV